MLIRRPRAQRVIDEERYVAERVQCLTPDARAGARAAAGRSRPVLSLPHPADGAALIRRRALRAEYRAKLARGELRAPSCFERLALQADGHADLDSTRAARRMLARHFQQRVDLAIAAHSAFTAAPPFWIVDVRAIVRRVRAWRCWRLARADLLALLCVLPERFVSLSARCGNGRWLMLHPAPDAAGFWQLIRFERSCRLRDAALFASRAAALAVLLDASDPLTLTLTVPLDQV